MSAPSKENLKARKWLINGGNGHEYGEAGIRAMIINGECLVEFLAEYAEHIQSKRKKDGQKRNFQARADDISAIIRKACKEVAKIIRPYTFGISAKEIDYEIERHLETVERSIKNGLGK